MAILIMTVHSINTQSIFILLDSQAAIHQAIQGYVDGGKQGEGL